MIQQRCRFHQCSLVQWKCVGKMASGPLTNHARVVFAGYDTCCEQTLTNFTRGSDFSQLHGLLTPPVLLPSVCYATCIRYTIRHPTSPSLLLYLLLYQCARVLFHVTSRRPTSRKSSACVQLKNKGSSMIYEVVVLKTLCKMQSETLAKTLTSTPTTAGQRLSSMTKSSEHDSLSVEIQ